MANQITQIADKTTLDEIKNILTNDSYGLNSIMTSIKNASSDDSSSLGGSADVPDVPKDVVEEYGLVKKIDRTCKEMNLRNFDSELGTISSMTNDYFILNDTLYNITSSGYKIIYCDLLGDQLWHDTYLSFTKKSSATYCIHDGIFVMYASGSLYTFNGVKVNCIATDIVIDTNVPSAITNMFSYNGNLYFLSCGNSRQGISYFNSETNTITYIGHLVNDATYIYPSGSSYGKVVVANNDIFICNQNSIWKVTTEYLNNIKNFTTDAIKVDYCTTLDVFSKSYEYNPNDNKIYMHYRGGQSSNSTAVYAMDLNDFTLTQISTLKTSQGLTYTLQGFNSILIFTGSIFDFLGNIFYDTCKPKKTGEILYSEVSS